MAVPGISEPKGSTFVDLTFQLEIETLKTAVLEVEKD